MARNFESSAKSLQADRQGALRGKLLKAFPMVWLGAKKATNDAKVRHNGLEGRAGRGNLWDRIQGGWIGGAR
jgi:hypothetical protein